MSVCRDVRQYAGMAATPRSFWDKEAATFDDEPDHGLTDPRVRQAWQAMLLPLLPPPPARVVDLGCGTGSLSSLLADEGHDVVGIDFAEQMVRRATSKAAAAGLGVGFAQADVEHPPLSDASVDAVLGRHILWATTNAEAALHRWIRLLRPSGVLILIEGRWQTGVGLGAEELQNLVRPHRNHVEVVPLDDAVLWGQPIDDERYLLLSRS